MVQEKQNKNTLKYMKTNWINLQREDDSSEWQGSGLPRIYNGWNDSRHRSSGVGGKEPQGFFSQKNVGGITDHILKAELEKANKKDEDIFKFYSEWCKQNKRNGGVLVSQSIREFLTAIQDNFTLIKK